MVTMKKYYFYFLAPQRGNKVREENNQCHLVHFNFSCIHVSMRVCACISNRVNECVQVAKEIATATAIITRKDDARKCGSIRRKEALTLSLLLTDTFL